MIISLQIPVGSTIAIFGIFPGAANTVVRRKGRDVAKREKVDTVVKEKDSEAARERKIRGGKTENFLD